MLNGVCRRWKSALFYPRPIVRTITAVSSGCAATRQDVFGPCRWFENIFTCWGCANPRILTLTPNWKWTSMSTVTIFEVNKIKGYVATLSGRGGRGLGWNFCSLKPVINMKLYSFTVYEGRFYRDMMRRGYLHNHAAVHAKYIVQNVRRKWLIYILTRGKPPETATLRNRN